MSVETFLKLKEFDSLSKVRINHLKALSEQEDRLSKLNERREANLMQTSILNQSNRDTQQQLFETEKQLKVLTEQKQRLLDIGNADKANLMQKDIDELEAKGFEFLERIENNETELADHKTFLTGLEKTIKEIQDEVKEETDKIQNEVKNIDLRLESLKDELPADFQNLLTKTLAKKLAHGPFTRIENGSCFFCRYKISRMDESEIDMQKMLKTCPQCSRIFLPYGA